MQFLKLGTKRVNVFDEFFTLTMFIRILPWQFEFPGNRHLGCCDHWMQIGEFSSNQYTALWCSCQLDLTKPAIHTVLCTISLQEYRDCCLQYREHQSSQMPQITGLLIILHGKDLYANKLVPQKWSFSVEKTEMFPNLTCYFFKFN